MSARHFFCAPADRPADTNDDDDDNAAMKDCPWRRATASTLATVAGPMPRGTALKKRNASMSLLRFKQQRKVASTSFTSLRS